MSSIRSVVILGFLFLLCHSRVAAQKRMFPSVGSFELPEASPRVHGFVGRLIAAKMGDSRFGQDHEGEVVLGENFPLVALKEGRRPIVLGFGSQVYGRFSLTDPKSALISTDWVVGFNTTATLDAWALTLELYHESSHLGDEYGARFPSDRIDWTREAVVGWTSFVTGVWRLIAGASYVLRDELRLPPPGVSFGIDYHGRSRRSLTGQVRPVGGVFFQADAATSWRVSSSAKLGVAFGTGDAHDISLGLIAHDGLDPATVFPPREPVYRHGAPFRPVNWKI